MRVVIVYKEESDHAREVFDYLADMDRQTGKTLEQINPDTPDGTQFCRAYDVVEYPTILAIEDNGQLLSMWRGRPLPMIGEVSYYVG